tara:strand:+ start:187 stop:594 length:408 start_codon:yes stop_codon:yes gene_type:complete
MKVKESELISKIIKPLQKKINKGTIICLEGQMGSGKTTFVHYFCQEIGVFNVSSPTFNLANIYDGKLRVYHLDLYRLNSKSELYSIDIERYISQTDGITFIEWPDRLGDLYPQKGIRIIFNYCDEFMREIKFKAF